MANDLKASVSITADTSGLISGVNGAMDKINRISANTSAMAGMMGASKVIDLAKQLWDAMGERSDHLSKLAHTFSPEAMTSAANLSQEQLKSDMAVGQALGPAQAGIDRAKQDAITEETDRTLKNAEAIGEGMIAYNAILDQAKKMGQETADQGLMALSGLMNAPENIQTVMDNPTESANAILGAISDTLGSIFGKIGGD
jgi:hypothetical protein